MKRAFFAITVAILLASAALAQLPVCNVAAQIYDVNGQPRANFRITVVRIIKNGQLLSRTPITYTTNASGQVTISLPQTSTAYIYCNAYALDANGTAGVPLSIPAQSSAQLEALANLATVLTTLGDTLYSGMNGVPTRLAGNTTTTPNFLGQTGTGSASAAPAWWSLVAGANVGLSYNIVNKTVTISSTGGGGGGGSLTTREVDGSPSITTTTLEFNQANGLMLTDQGGGVARLGLSGVPYSALSLTSAILGGDLANDAVTFAKIQNLTTDRLIGRDTASSGDPEEIALAGSLVFTGSQSIQLSGDSASPGNSKYYGTNGSGTKGFYDLPTGGSPHNLLSGTHSDTTTGSVARGDLITGQGGSATWQRLAIGAANRALISDGTDAAWSTVTNAALANSSLTITAGAGLINGGSVALGGSTTLDIGAGTGILANANDVAVDQSFAPTWTGVHAYNPGTTPANAIVLDIAAIGSAGTRDSHNLLWRGRSDDGSAHAVEWRAFADMTSNAGASTFTVQSKVDAASFANRLTISDAGAVVATSFSGDGSALTALNASNLSSGTVSNSLLDSDLAALGNNSTNGIWARTGSGTGSARTITAGSSSITVTNGDGVSGNPTIDAVQNIQTTATPQFARLGLNGAAGSVTSLKITGPTINTDADATIAVMDSSWSLTKNDSNTRQFYGWKFKPTLNTGVSNANTTVNLLDVDTTNTAVTGVTTNLLKLSYGGTQALVVTSAGNTTVAGTFTATGAQTLTGNTTHSGNVTFNKATYSTAVGLTDASTIATDASLGNRYRVTLAGNRTLGNPSNPTDGQQIVWEIVQDGTGSRTISLDTKFALGTDITAVTLSTTANKRDFLTAIYNSTADKWFVVGFIKGY